MKVIARAQLVDDTSTAVEITNDIAHVVLRGDHLLRSKAERVLGQKKSNKHFDYIYIIYIIYIISRAYIPLLGMRFLLTSSSAFMNRLKTGQGDFWPNICKSHPKISKTCKKTYIHDGNEEKKWTSPKKTPKNNLNPE